MDPELEPDRAPECPHPRETYDLTGHEAAEAEVADAWAGGRMHHAWLITGPKGVGKATLAYRIARRALGARAVAAQGVLGADPDDPVSRRIEAQSHSDLMVIRRPWDDRNKKVRAEITVDEARRVEHLFEQSAGEGGWRVVIVDSVDEMNPNAANAWLKTLEEPPKRALLLLVSHAPGRLLPTIRSRCRTLRLRPLSDAALEAFVRRFPGAAGDAELIARLSQGAPGKAAALAAAGAADLHKEASSLFGALPDLDIGRAYKLGDRLSRAASKPELALFHEFAQRFAQERARIAAGADDDPLFAAPRGASAAGGWLGAWETLMRLEREQEGLYLDPKQTVLAALSTLRDAAA